MTWLTKSKFLAGLQCHKRLWFEEHEPLEELPTAGIPLLQGREFDEVVQRLEPGVVISRDQGMAAAIAETERVLRAGAPVLYQPAFRSGDLAVIADLIRRDGESFDLIEVKASTAVKETHVPDAAYQALVIERAGIRLRRISIGHVNSEFKLERLGDYHGLLTETDVTAAVRASLRQVADSAESFQAVMASGRCPPIDVGAHCTSPYDCPFMPRCHPQRASGAGYPIVSLPRGAKTSAALFAEGYSDLREVPAERLSSEMHRRVHAAVVSGVPYFNESATRELRRLKPPFAYLDFETMGFAVPEIIGTRPYEQLPFQWSVHGEDAGEIRHAEYLAVESFGDFQALAEALIAALPPSGAIFAYNASFEDRVLRRLGELVPSRKLVLGNLADRLFDLLPVTREAYYHRDMQGSWSIKSVIPTIAPELRYGELEEVQDGGTVQLAFLELRNAQINPDRKLILRRALLQYCARDTEVLIVLRRFLNGDLPNVLF